MAPGVAEGGAGAHLLHSAYTSSGEQRKPRANQRQRTVRLHRKQREALVAKVLVAAWAATARANVVAGCAREQTVSFGSTSNSTVAAIVSGGSVARLHQTR